jgi:hypothetical protein
MLLRIREKNYCLWWLVLWFLCLLFFFWARMRTCVFNYIWWFIFLSCCIDIRYELWSLKCINRSARTLILLIILELKLLDRSCNTCHSTLFGYVGFSEVREYLQMKRVIIILYRVLCYSKTRTCIAHISLREQGVQPHIKVLCSEPELSSSSYLMFPVKMIPLVSL